MASFTAGWSHYRKGNGDPGSHMMVAATFQQSIEEEGTIVLSLAGAWVLGAGLLQIDPALRAAENDVMGKKLIIDMTGVETLDTAGAMMLQRVMLSCPRRDDPAVEGSEFIGMSREQAVLIAQAGAHAAECEVTPRSHGSFIRVLERVGRSAHTTLNTAVAILSFLGETLTTFIRISRHPKRLRLTSVIHHMEETGLDALPIVGLMSFLIGAVVAFMGAEILSQFNAEVFTVELIGISVLREFGILLTAILVAGRSGSAFTAQLGSMKLREEIDAMQAMGVDPVEVLVIPRVIALVLFMPLLGFLAALLGLLGGGLVAWLAMDIPPAFFLARTQETVLISNFWVGLIKAPFFAFVIAIVGCYQGVMVSGSAEELGRRTTLSVVQALFLVILLDALFAILFLRLGV